jgi:hypothetical protein
LAGVRDIFAATRVKMGAAIDCWIPLILAVGRGNAISVGWYVGRVKSIRHQHEYSRDRST